MRPFGLDDPRYVAVMTDHPDAILKMLKTYYPHGTAGEAVGRKSEMQYLFSLSLMRMRMRPDLALPCIETFLAYGFDLKFYDSVNRGNSLLVSSRVPPSLILACKHNNVQLLNIFLRYGADPNTKATQDISDKCVVHLACSFRGTHLAIVRALLAAGANPNVEDLRCETALHAAVVRERIDIVNLLLSYGAHVNALDRWKGSPLLRALDWNHNQVEIVALLLSQGALLDDIALGYPDIKHSYILSAVHRPGASLEVLQKLVENGAVLDRQDFHGMNPLHIVCELRLFAFVKYLMLVKFDPDVESRSGRSPMDFALQPPRRGFMQLKVVHLLREAGALLHDRDIRIATTLCVDCVKDYITYEAKHVLPLSVACQKVIRTAVHSSVQPAAACAAFEKLPLPRLVVDNLLFRNL